MTHVITRLARQLRTRREEGDSGFSLIELIVVVAILGVLVAIAIPVFGNIQGTARLNAVKAVAANGATQATALLAQASPATLIASGDANITVGWGKVSGTAGTAPTTIDTVCVWASYTGDTAAKATSGPGC
ncbi:MAG TPA: type II secretion system protein [Propionicimonas sp.]|jgi:prepilin-type N-terminal cleavage/methylation domain-containing protein